jgi:ATP-dependent DNA ligase
MSIVVDGEVLGDSYQVTSKAKGSDNQTAKDTLKFYAFDWCSLPGWIVEYSPTAQHYRSAGLEKNIKKCKLTKVVKSKWKLIHNMDEAKAFYEEMLAEGYEGLILKDPEACYEWKRSRSWTKWKPVFDVDLTIEGFYFGDENGKNADKLGGLNLRGADENGNKIVTKCGGFAVQHPKTKAFVEELAKKAKVDLSKTTYDQFLRDYIMTHQDEFLGEIAQVEFQELSLAEGSDTYSLRFPVFIMIRKDK